MDRVIERIIALLETHVKTSRGIKKIYNGRRSNLSTELMPAIIVKSGGTGARSTAMDNYRNVEDYNIDIQIMTAATDTIGNASTTGERAARKIAEERENTNEPKTDTVLGVLVQQLIFDAGYTKNVTINKMIPDPSPSSIYSFTVSITVTGIPYSIKKPN